MKVDVYAEMFGIKHMVLLNDRVYVIVVIASLERVLPLAYPSILRKKTLKLFQASSTNIVTKLSLQEVL